jgi:putative spermidine/putrescine transport system permease protein
MTSAALSEARAGEALTGETLAGRVRMAGRRRRLVTFLLLLPSVVFVALLFIAPVGLFLFRSVDNSEVSDALVRTVPVLGRWNGSEPIPDAAFEALAQDLSALRDTPAAAQLARRLSYNATQFRGLILGTIARLQVVESSHARQQLVAIDRRWDDIGVWKVLRLERHRLTKLYFLSALDLEMTADGDIRRAPEETAVFIDLYLRTFFISGMVTLFCVVLGFPVALAMASARPSYANLMLMLVLVPFWTSLLVRTTAWIIILQSNGIVNQFLQYAGLTDHPIPLVFNRTGLYIGMVQVLLPFAILPMYSAFKSLPADLTCAAASLGAKPYQRFIHIFLPQAAPGIFAAAILVFVLCLGYYVAPALIGGPADQMIGYFIAYFTNSAVNWGMASALGVILLAAVAALYAVVGRLTKYERLAQV